jgi:transposase
MAISDHPMPFGDVLEAVDRLTPEEQETLAAIIHRRLAERGRKQLAEDIRGARQEFGEGGCRPAAADELMGEILG